MCYVALMTKTTLLNRVLLLLGAGLLAIVVSSDNCPADDVKGTRPAIYDPAMDGEKQVAAALVQAKKEDKRVLIQFGANWCIWCHRLHGLFKSDEGVAAELKRDYVLILVDVDKTHNHAMVEKYKAEKLGLPSLVVLDADGKHVKTQNTDALEEGDHHSPVKVMAFLKEFAPKR